MMIKFRHLFLALTLLAAPVAAQQSEFIFAVNEGVTYRITPQESRDRYKEIGEMLSKALKRPVKVVPVDNYVKLRQNLEAKTYDLAYVHPAHHSLRAIRDQKYQLVAITKGFETYKARFLMKPDAPFTKPVDVLAVNMVMPDPDSITAWMVRATLRDLGKDASEVKLGTTRFQDGIPFMLENGFYEIGATASGAVVKDWQSKGGKILFESKPVPIKHIIAAPSVSAEDVEKIRAVFLGLETTKEGQAILERLKFKGYALGDEKQMADLTKWLGI
ncbi:MAG TPA: PhnD/SsuA/transferrin family substrate-binding protein [Burkholderiales bacterium]|nr:PhnD/SsuA/transferrin family substrate-binding protein [Burkholderiales bacterium]